jgi:hypothetical protein
MAAAALNKQKRGGPKGKEAPISVCVSLRHIPPVFAGQYLPRACQSLKQHASVFWSTYGPTKLRELSTRPQALDPAQHRTKQVSTAKCTQTHSLLPPMIQHDYRRSRAQQT